MMGRWRYGKVRLGATIICVHFLSNMDLFEVLLDG